MPGNHGVVRTNGLPDFLEFGPELSGMFSEVQVVVQYRHPCQKGLDHR